MGTQIEGRPTLPKGNNPVSTLYSQARLIGQLRGIPATQCNTIFQHHHSSRFVVDECASVPWTGTTCSVAVRARATGLGLRSSPSPADAAWPSNARSETTSLRCASATYRRTSATDAMTGRRWMENNRIGFPFFVS